MAAKKALCKDNITNDASVCRKCSRRQWCKYKVLYDSLLKIQQRRKEKDGTPNKEVEV